MAMPLPPPPSYHQPPPPYPAGPPRYPQPPPPHPGAPHGYPPPPPNQSWGNSPWHYLQHWENQDRNIDYNDEEDWAARARAWAAAKSITENSLSAQFTPIGRTEIQNHIQHGLFQQPAGPPGEALHSSLSANQHLSTVSDPQRWATHVKESSSYAADSQASHASTSEGLVAEDTTPKQVKYGSTSYFFEQEVPSSYSTIPGEEIGNQYRQLKMSLPPSASSIQDGLHSSQSMQHFHSMSGQQPHMAYSGQFTVSSTDPSDQPLVFEQRYSFDHDQDQKMNFRDTNTAGSLSGMDQIDAAPPIHAWAPPVGFSHIPAVPSGSQFDSSLGQLSSVPGNHPSVFGGNPGPSFHSNIPPPVGAQFGLGAGATIHPPAAFPEDVNGSFNYVERPKKASVPNWLREELIKKKAAIVSSLQEQPIGSFQAVGDDNSGKLFGKADQADSKSIESNKSAEDDEDDEDNVEAARAAAINQEIKRVLTDILLKVTDELFEEIATKVLDEDDLSVEVDHTVALSHQKVTSPVIITPKTTAKVIVPGQDRSAKASNFEQSESASPRGNILGLANYASDEDDGNVEGPSIITSVPTEGISFNQVENNKTAEETVKTVEKGTAQERADPSGSSSVFRNGDGKGYSKEASKSESGYSELPISVHTGHADKIVSERNNCYPKETATAKIDTESTDMNVTNGQSLRDTSQEARSRAGSTNRSHDRSISRNDAIKKEKTGGEEFSAAHEHRRGETRDRMIEKMDRQVNFQKASKGHDFKEGKRIDASEYKKRNISESGRGDRRESEKDKKTGVKEDGDRKKENTKEDRRGQGGRDSHRSKSRHSPSPSSKVISGKASSFASHGGASSGDVSEESRKRRPHSSRHSLSRSPPRSRRRQVSPSPHSKHSDRRHSPNSYSDIRRRSRSASPVRRRK